MEWKALSPAFAGGRHRDRIVVSMHDFSGIPDDLADRVAAMRATGAGIVKVAVMAHRLTDNLTLLDRVRPTASPTVVIAMGEAGLATRVLAARFGSLWTYAADATPVAPGQTGAERMRDEFRLASLGPETSLYGVVGRPVSHSLSPSMHNAAFAALGLDAVYLPLAAADFEDFRTFAEALDLRGASVTAPFKVAAFELAGAVDADGRRAAGHQHAAAARRAVGRAQHRRRRVHGATRLTRRARGPARNRARRRRGRPVGRHGAAGRRARTSRSRLGASDQAEEAAARAGAAVAAWPPAPGTWDLLVNATPIGTSPAVTDSPLAGERVGRPARLRPGLQPAAHPAAGRRRRAAAARSSADSTCSSPRRSRSSPGGPAPRPPEPAMREAALARLHEEHGTT